MKRMIIATSNETTFNASNILDYLRVLDAELGKHNMKGDIDIYGGAVMCLGLNARESTHDIDAIFKPSKDIRAIVADIAKQHGLDEGWLNDGVKGFVSDKGEFYRFGENIFKNLRVCMTTPEYLFAMKCLSCRTVGDSPTEISDIKFLINYLKLTSVEQAEDIILKYYPKSLFKPRTHYVLLEIFDELSNSDESLN